MDSLRSTRRLAALVFGIFAAAAIAACGGNSSPGSTPSTTAPGSSPTTNPSPSSSAAATFPCNTATASSSGTLSNATDGTPATYPPLGSCDATITFQSGTTIAAGTSVNVTTSQVAPAGAPSPLPTAPSGVTGSVQTIIFETLAVQSGSITLGSGSGQSPEQTVTLASTGTCTSTEYYSAFAANGSWQSGWDGSGSLSGLTVTFAPGEGNGGTLTAGNTYYVVFACY
ncbi:MAG TPA: hypothetical protein VMD47_04560 [Candidatus Acidoferrales bacterium]|nr:hypothetical protein [Candidatus Acidoferrales bacterium]